MSMKVFVTGGAGYVGSHCVRHLREQGDEVLVYDNLTSGHRRAVGDAPLVAGDLGDPDLLDQTLADFRPDAVMHFAASLFPRESTQRPLKYYRNNVVNTVGLLEAMERHDVRRLVFSSTCAVYGKPPGTPVTESMPTRPISPYGRTKLVMEQAMADCAAAWGLVFAALRYFNAAGAAKDGSIGEDHRPEVHLIPLVIAAALGRREHVCIYGTDYDTPDGTCIRDYVHVEDLATAHRFALERLMDGASVTCNLGVGKGHSVREVVEAVRRVSGADFEVKEVERRAGDPPALFADASLARRELGWSPAHPDLQEIVADAWRWHSRHPDGFGDDGAWRKGR